MKIKLRKIYQLNFLFQYRNVFQYVTNYHSKKAPNITLQ